MCKGEGGGEEGVRRRRRGRGRVCEGGGEEEGCEGEEEGGGEGCEVEEAGEGCVKGKRKRKEKGV